MVNKKFKLGETVEVDGHSLRRLVALRNFNDVREGDQGGLIKSETMLNPEDESWVYGDSAVYGEGSYITGDSEIYDNATVVSSTIESSVVRNYSRVENSNLHESYIHKSSNVYASKLDNARLSHNSQVTRSKLERVSTEATYIQDTILADIDDAHSAYIDGERTQLEAFDSFELGQYDEHNVHELIENHRVEAVELSDDDLSDLNDHQQTIGK